MKIVLFPLIALVAGYLVSRVFVATGNDPGVLAEDVNVGLSERSQSSARSAEPSGFEERFRAGEHLGDQWRQSEKFFTEWFREDPDAAMRAIKNSSVNREGGKPTFLLCFLFEDDPVALEAMGRYLDDIITFSRWHESGFDGEVHREFDFKVGKELIDKVKGLPESYAKKDLFNYAMAGWFYKDWKEATAWSASLPVAEREAAEKAFLYERLPRGLARDTEARRWVATVLGKEKNRRWQLSGFEPGICEGGFGGCIRETTGGEPTMGGESRR